MKRLMVFALALGVGGAAWSAEKPSPESVKSITKKVADWQVSTFEDQVRYRAVSTSKRKIIEEMGDRKPKTTSEKYAMSFTKKWHDLEWHNAALYAGMNEWRKVADNSEPYTQWLYFIGERNGWKPHRRKYHADDHAVGHFYLALYEESKDPKLIAKLRERFDWIIENPKTGSLEMKKGTDADDRWGWCDALFMAPPVWARMAKVTGEQKYLDFMDQEYHATYDLLWSKEHQLFFRDTRYFTRAEANGEKIFWSRGNGWVFSGLALMIPDLPQHWEGRPFYVDTFRQMAETLKKTQRADGTWSMGLLGDLKDYPIPETSGTSFFTHGLAWGINNGLLDRATYEPVVLKAWAALTACVTEEGLLGNVQPVGAAPGESYPDKTDVYGVGAFLAAGSEVYKLVGGVAKPTPQAVKALTKKVADWQIETFEDQVKYRARSAGTKKMVARYWKNPDDPKYKDYWSVRRTANKWHDLEWHNGALYAGMNQWRKVSGDPEAEAFLMKIGERNDWKLFKRPYNADDHTVGQFYLSLYEEIQDPAMLKPTQEHFDWILANPKTGSLEWTTRKMKESGKHTDCHNRWGWCDSLFMAPPVWARLARVTGERKYLDFMDQEYHATYDLLWDKEDRFFWRDSSYFKRREANGRKLYWARGNGWVFGGLALMIPDLPEDWEGRPFYIDLFKQMAESLRNCQREDGTWSMGLLGGAEAYPNKETSGTSFYAFGLAWGINNGILDRATYEPVVLKAWKTLAECVTEDGMLVWVQPVGAAPGESFGDKTEVYGIGAFLAAGAEVYKMVGGEESAGLSYQTFMTDTGWCWYEDPRAIINNGKLVIGGISGKSGDVRVGVYDLEADKPQGVATLHEKFQADDHNSPVFHVRPDGSLLTVYAKHAREPFHYYAISDSVDYLKWGTVKKFHHDYHKKGVTYMNLYTMEDEGLLYNFFRDGPHFNPAFITSADNGKTWGDYHHLITHDIGGRHRPYARYVQVDENTVGISFTDAHPRQYGNSLYYAEFKGGAFYNVDGTKIKDLSDGPLRTGDAEKLYKGSEINEWKGHEHSVSNAAWTCAIASDADRHPHIGYTLYLTHDDHRYRVASWDGLKWNDREIAYGGTCLYDHESSYTGLFCFDPKDPTQVYISTDVDPKTGKSFGGVHEIYTAKIGPTDDISSIDWKPLTFGSEYKNIRPIVVAGDGYKVLMWLGNKPWTHFQNYETDAVGMILERP
ncbi:glycoside hydrolase family 88 protein [Pontiellaceae bacterium B12227]|nr:glycoside hydrolase family 88 protein [Pontiellaceae bacterium B12227]